MNKNLQRFYNWLEDQSNFLLFDIEANFKEDNLWKDFETIQIGYIKFNYKFEVITHWSIYINPKNHKELHPFIQELTGINQKQVDNWLCFPPALKQFISLYNKETDYLMSYWYYDMKQLYKDSNTNNLEYPFYENDEWRYSKHINIKNAIAKKINIREKWMWNLLKYLNLNLIWKHHNWEDDCLNILEIIKYVFNGGENKK